MADCLSLLYFVDEPTEDAEETVWFSGCTTDGTVHVGRSVSTGQFLTLTNFTGPPSIIFSPINSTSKPVVDASNDIWWVETADFVSFSLRRCEIDGSSVTTVATVTGLPTFDFEMPQISYDPFADRFWFAYFTSPDRGLWTMSKTGVVVKRYAATPQTGYGAIVTNDAAVWGRFEETVVRVDGSSFASSTGTAVLFSNRFAPAVPTGSGGAFWTVENGTSYEYGPGVSKSVADCDMDDYDDWGNLPTAYTTPDFTQIFLSIGGGCPSFSIIWGHFVEVGGIPPLRIYIRDDAESIGGARSRQHGSGSVQMSSRIRQGAGYL